MENIKIGSHLEVDRKKFYDLIDYTHHGIYIGNNQVIHYSGNKIVEQDTLENFLNGNNYRIIEHSNRLDTNSILKNATSKLGESKYDFLQNNCEHFAVWCATGKHISKQVNMAKQVAVPFILVFAVASAVYFWRKNKNDIKE
ncbi:hypothetical protein CCY99_01005 [Helicobacter sp. 16-1353]|uniref:lecithin retinol acyltransferase family protein n=1 Tax=Helicobacter sp. 16-1353 TaxID=2004996 RepID=UPI000DCCD6CA|nr:lecithin retinol acyltransferase family protein [Helicobacter sp. 16-1353]RAX55310.1 hypothetical protein CCY99_01005 [Helicobacter sp. 16-1353]